MCPACPEPTPAQREALGLDFDLARAARGCSVFELAIGATLDALFRGERLAELGFSREADYARERMGVPPSTMFSWLRLARELAHRPLLRAAVGRGLVSTRKALAVLPLAEGDLEAAWTEAAMRLTLREIAAAVRAAGKEDPEERFQCESVVLRMGAGQQARLDAALAFAKRQIGPEARRWQCMEAMCEEWLSSHGEWEGAPGEGEASAPAPDPARGKLLARQIAAAGEAEEALAGIGKEPMPGNALGLDARVRRLLLARREWDESLGVLLLRAREAEVHRTLGYGTFEAYCEERLGMRAATARQRIWLERRMRRLPALRDALRSGRLTYSKTLAVARHAGASDVDDRVARAAETTCQQTEREGEAEEDRKNRGANARKLWAPREAAETVRKAIGSAQAWSLGTRGARIDEGEALAVVADHFVEVSMRHRPPDRGRIDPRRREVLMRKGGLCAVPGCSRAACHLHHVVYRSRGGGDDPGNLVGLCAVHHLHGIHLGHLEVTGRAGERLHWKLGTGEAVPLEEWFTLGDDDVRRAGAAASAGAGGPDARGAATTAGDEGGDGSAADGSAADDAGGGSPAANGPASGGSASDGPSAEPGSSEADSDGAGFVSEAAAEYTAPGRRAA